MFFNPALLADGGALGKTASVINCLQSLWWEAESESVCNDLCGIYIGMSV